MRALLALLFLAAIGCTGPALPLPPHDPMAIVWEYTYGMERASRPAVQWHSDCRAEDAGVGQERAVSVFGGCVVAIVFADGRIELQEAPRVSASVFALALQEWKGWLTQTAFAPIDGVEVAAANRTLRAENF